MLTVHRFELDVEDGNVVLREAGLEPQSISLASPELEAWLESKLHYVAESPSVRVHRDASLYEKLDAFKATALAAAAAAAPHAEPAHHKKKHA